MLKGTQLEIRTPGKNQKHYLAAALNPATGRTYYVLGPKKNNVLFRELLNHLLRSSAFSAMFTTNAHATILGSICEPWSWTWKNIWRKTARGSTDCQRSTTLQKWIWKWMYYESALLLGSKSSVPILVAPI